MISAPHKVTKFNYSKLASTNSTAGTTCWCTSQFLFPEITNELDKTCKRKILNILLFFFTFANNTMVNWIHHHTKLPELPKHPLYCNHKWINTPCFFLFNNITFGLQSIFVFCLLFFLLYPWICMMKYHWLTEFFTIWAYVVDLLYSRSTH